jgi:hypothetical protein
MITVTDIRAVTDAEGAHLGWTLEATITIGANTRCGAHWAALPADATPEAIAADVLAQYGA